MTTPGGTRAVLQRMRRFKPQAISLVDRGAESKSRFALVQAAAAPDAPATLPAITQHYTAQLAALTDPIEQQLLITQFTADLRSSVAALSQGAVSDELAQNRAERGGWDLWCAFQQALEDCEDDGAVMTAIDELAALLKEELVPTPSEPAVAQTAPEATPTTPAGEPAQTAVDAQPAVAQSMPQTEGDIEALPATTTPAPVAVTTPAPVVAQAAPPAQPAPVSPEIVALAQGMDGLNTLITALVAKVDAIEARQVSPSGQPVSQQPDLDPAPPTPAVAQTAPSKFAGSHADDYIKSLVGKMRS